MTDHSAESSDSQKRIKHLENEKIKYTKLLEAIVSSNDEASRISELKDEAEGLKETMKDLEKEKTELQSQLSSVLKENGENEKEDLEIQDLKTENENLRQILAGLEKEKLKLLGYM